MASAIPDYDDNIVHLFVWVIHGINVSSNNVHHPMEYKFNSLSIYSHPLMQTNVAEISKYIQDPCKYLLSCPILPIIDKDTQKRMVYVPPLIFKLYETDGDIIQGTQNKTLKDYIGLYYLQIKRNGDICTIMNGANGERILDYSKIQSIFSYYYISYSKLFNITKEVCEKKQLTMDKVSIGLFSCQKDTLFSLEYDKKTSKLIPHISYEVFPATILSEITENNELMYFDASHITDNWDTLASMKHQGCGLNVLAYLNIIEKSYAREKVACLESGHGTSIFKIVDYINYKYPNTYTIIRTNIKKGLNIVYDKLKSLNTPSAIIIKIYEIDTINNKKNYYGHTVLIATDGANIYYIDPQQNIYLQLDSSFSVLNTLQSFDKYKSIDLIYVNTPTANTNSIKTDFYGAHDIGNNMDVENIMDFEQNDFLILSRDNIHYGGIPGSGNGVSLEAINPRLITSSLVSNSNESAISKTKKNKHNNNYVLDDFEKITLLIDKKKSKLILPPRSKKNVELFLKIASKIKKTVRSYRTLSASSAKSKSSSLVKNASAKSGSLVKKDSSASSMSNAKSSSFVPSASSALSNFLVKSASSAVSTSK